MHKSHPGLPDGVRFGLSSAEEASPQALNNIVLPPLSISLLNLIAAQDLANQIAHGLVKTADFQAPFEEEKIAC